MELTAKQKYDREYRRLHREKYNKHQKKYSEKNKDKRKEYFKEYYCKNSELIIATKVSKMSMINDASRIKANNHRQLWTKRECDLILSDKYSIAECAVILGRTIVAIKVKKSKLCEISPNIEKLMREVKDEEGER